ncbi:exonuclease SbcCD subunit D [Micromonospora sp. LOL_021]|uniref:exonuclease SbcCD subunit D n=1 Tax=Micromonospora sp. LOL_021 TaxID=3345417 RepID=UPI003A8C34C5
MRILHTSDWHVGKVLKGQARLPEQIQVLARVVEIARTERPDLVIVAGDLYDTSAPGPDATRVVTRALTALRGTGADVVAIGGNHDNGAALDALRPWADAAGITLRGAVRDKPDEHVITGTTGDGEPWRLVALPFLSQRYAVRATEMYQLTAAEANQTYADHIARVLARLTDGFGEPGVVDLITAHLTVIGGRSGGGEREVHTVLGYAVPATVFPTGAHYVALGHLHRAQQLEAPCPVRYSGSPLPIDFGEEDNVGSVSIVDVTAGTAARVREVPVDAATPLRTVHGTLDELAAGEYGDAWLRVFIRETPRAGLREEVQALLPRALDVRIDPEFTRAASAAGATHTPQRAGRAPGQLFADYLDARGHGDDDVRTLFDTLYEEVTSS